MTDMIAATTKIETDATSRKPDSHFWRGNIFETVAAFWHRDAGIHDDWLEERDTIAITVALSRLSDRQLARIGMNRTTLPLDIEDLKEFSDRNREITEEILRIVDTGDAPKMRRQIPHQIAAE